MEHSPPPQDEVPDWWRPYALGLAAVACTLWYVHDANVLSRREDRASTTFTQVVRIDDQDNIYVELDPSIAIPVLHSNWYEVGSSVEVLYTPDGGRLWIRPVAEPQDVTSPLTFAVGLAAVAMVLVAGHIQRSRAHQRLARATAGIPLAVTIGRDGLASIRAIRGGVQMAVIRLKQQGDPGSTEEPAATRQATYRPRDDEPEARPPWGTPPGTEPVAGEPAGPAAAAKETIPAALIGEFAIGGWAGLVVGDALLLPRCSVRARNFWD